MTGTRPAPSIATAAAEPAPRLYELLQLRDDTAKPLYQQLRDRLIALISDGTLPAGITLPAERQLAARLNISRATVQRCYNALRDGNLLSAQGRLGSVVQAGSPRLQPGMDRLKGFTEEMRELGRVPSSLVVERAVVNDRSIASIFGLPSHARLLRLVRVRSGDGIPMSRESAWYNLERVPALADADLSGSVYDVLAGFGAALLSCEQTIEAAAPTAEECATFGFSDPQPCLLIKRRSFSADRSMIEYVEGLFRGDLYAYRLLLKA